MFLFWRMIVLAVALAAVLYGIGRSRIRRRRIAAVLGAALCLLAMSGFRHVSGEESGDVLPLAGGCIFLYGIG